MEPLSPLQIARYEYQPKLPGIFRRGIGGILAAEVEGHVPECGEALKVIFPHTCGLKEVRFQEGDSAAARKRAVIGVILSGGQAPGGHNVIAGLYDAIKEAGGDNSLIGFKNGPAGLLRDDCLEFTDEIIDRYRNTGGFDIIGSGRTKLETEEQFRTTAAVCAKRGITAIVIIGGDDSNTNAAMLAEYFIREGSPIQVIGCPKTIDGDLKSDSVEISFGFDSATKTYSSLIGNIARDANSSKKYWHFVKVMGRSASHIALECALQTQPNICLISEEAAAKNISFSELAAQIAESVRLRADNGNNFGVVIIPESLIEFVPEFKELIAELNGLVSTRGRELNEMGGWKKYAFLELHLSARSFKIFSLLPTEIQRELLLDRDQHGNIQLSHIETEKLLIALVMRKLDELKNDGRYTGKFSPICHFFGYEGRCAFPSNFDADYCYSLGYNAFMLISYGYTGYLSTISNLAAPAAEWGAGGVPLTGMMNLELRKGKMTPVIKKTLVDLDGAPFKYFAERRERWARETCYVCPGAIQYYGPPFLCDVITKTLSLEQRGCV